MCKIYNYPSPEDLRVVEVAVSVFLDTRHGVARNVMQGAIRAILARYNVGRLSFPQYHVFAGQDGGIRVMPRQEIPGRECPECGTDIYGDKVTILSVAELGQGDMVAYGCSCGGMFCKWECE